MERWSLNTSEILGVLSPIAFWSEIFEQWKEANEEAREKMFRDILAKRTAE